MIENLGKPSIATLFGYCLGGGLALAVACDWRVCADNAMLRLPEVPLGINMSWQANPRITALVGPARAKEIIILGEDVAAATAHDWGLIDRLCAPGTCMEVAGELAAKVAELPPLPVRMTKQAINAHAFALNYAASFMDREQYALLTGSDDNKAAVRAVIDKSKTK